jgi:hypothetical protein
VQQFVLHWRNLRERSSVNRSVSQIHALLHASERPLTAQDIADALGMARSNVSNSLRELQGWEQPVARSLDSQRARPRSFRPSLGNGADPFDWLAGKILPRVLGSEPNCLSCPIVNFKAVAVRKALPHVCVGEKNHDQLEEFVHGNLRMRTQTYSYDLHPGVVQVEAEESPIMQNTGVS